MHANLPKLQVLKSLPFINLDETNDITLENHYYDYGVPDGVYRKVTPEFLGWIRKVINREKNKNPSNPDILKYQTFLNRLISESGMEPADPPIGYKGPKFVSYEWEKSW